MKLPSPVRRVIWFGDKVSAAKSLPILEGAGFDTVEMNATGSDGLEGAWAAVLFLADELSGDTALGFVMGALDVGVNVVAVSQKPNQEVGLRNRLEREHIYFSDEYPNGETDDQQTIVDVRLGGGEMRRVAFGAKALLPVIDRPSQIPKRNADLEPDLSVDGQTRELLQRSFTDATSLQLRRMVRGRSAEAVFAVVASMGEERPLPYVAKIADRDQIIREARKFEGRVRDFVPFSNRPNFLPQRSFVLAKRGILIGQFAQRAVPLDTAVRGGHAAGALHSLFSSVLHRWWANSFRAGSRPTMKLSAFPGLKRWFDSGEPTRVKAIAHHHEMATKLHGLSPHLPRVVVSRLNAVECPFRWSRIHGDLNCGNVLVRDDSPLLIDFSHCADGPLLADPAWLEVDLMFGCGWGDGNGNARQRTDWQCAVDKLYNPEWLRRPLPLDCGEGYVDEIYRLCSAVGTIRQNAFDFRASPKDYPALVAAALVRLCSRRDQGEDDVTRKAAERRSERAAVAYASASAIVETL